MDALSNWPRNRLLLALPARNLKQLMPELEQIRCQRAQVLMDADSSLHHVFFPDSGVYPVHVTTRKSLGLMMRKLSVTESQRSAQFRGTFSRRKPSVAS